MHRDTHREITQTCVHDDRLAITQTAHGDIQRSGTTRFQRDARRATEVNGVEVYLRVFSNGCTSIPIQPILELPA
jgi:hypothetical protein